MNDYCITYKLSFINYKNGFVVQLDRILDFGSKGWGFESLRSHKLPLSIKKCQKTKRFLAFLFSEIVHSNVFCCSQKLTI